MLLETPVAAYEQVEPNLVTPKLQRTHNTHYSKHLQLRSW
jgi:hypothetical protein